MVFKLSEAKIRQLCGDIAFKKGKYYFRAGKVKIHHFIESDSTVGTSVGEANFMLLLCIARKSTYKQDSI